jgi:hypothetical protein
MFQTVTSLLLFCSRVVFLVIHVNAFFNRRTIPESKLRFETSSLFTAVEVSLDIIMYNTFSSSRIVSIAAWVHIITHLIFTVSNLFMHERSIKMALSAQTKSFDPLIDGAVVLDITCHSLMTVAAVYQLVSSGYSIMLIALLGIVSTAVALAYSTSFKGTKKLAVAK